MARTIHRFFQRIFLREISDLYGAVVSFAVFFWHCDSLRCERSERHSRGEFLVYGIEEQDNGLPIRVIAARSDQSDTYVPTRELVDDLDAHVTGGAGDDLDTGLFVLRVQSAFLIF